MKKMKLEFIIEMCTSVPRTSIRSYITKNTEFGQLILLTLLKNNCDIHEPNINRASPIFCGNICHYIKALGKTDPGKDGQIISFRKFPRVVLSTRNKERLQEVVFFIYVLKGYNELCCAYPQNDNFVSYSDYCNH